MSRPTQPANVRPQEAPSSASMLPLRANRPETDASSSLDPNLGQQHSDGASRQRRRRPKGARRRRNRRESFAGSNHDPAMRPRSNQNPADAPGIPRPGPYALGPRGANASNTSLDSQALLDHRDQLPLPSRRQSGTAPNSFGQSSTQVNRFGQGNSVDLVPAYRSQYSNPFVQRGRRNAGNDGDEDDVTDTTPLIRSSQHNSPDQQRGSGAGVFGAALSHGYGSRNRRPSAGTSASSRQRNRASSSQRPPSGQGAYDVNNPPSVPPSPKTQPDAPFDDVMLPEHFSLSASPPRRARHPPGARDTLIDIDEDSTLPPQGTASSPQTPRAAPTDSRRRATRAAEEDVCFPVEGMSEMAEEDAPHLRDGRSRQGGRRRRGRAWPDLSILEEWSLEEKEQRSGGIGAKKISEPVLVGGRLRPNNRGWHRTEEDAPYRFTYFNEELPSTVHSQTISELVQPGQTFRELFIPDPPELSDDESDEGDDLVSLQSAANDQHGAANGAQRSTAQQPSTASGGKSASGTSSGDATPSQSHAPKQRPKRYGPRPVFWLDVLSPTDAEMRVISKAFGIHPLTAEDIFMQEAREKVELFRNYYFVNYRTFEQDVNSENYLDPVNMYVVVFREGVISFHFSMVPHPANVRRRIRQLKDYLILSSDWISYAIIDDITDVFAPLSQSLEDEVDDIEDSILQLRSSSPPDTKPAKDSEKRSEAGEGPSSDRGGGDMLRRVGDCRKRVISLYRLLGNKADVIKGFAKRCNEQWEVAPRSEIGLYLGDIQDHIVTMTSNLSHYESILSRSHSNYLAQINIRMNERQEQTADVLGRLTVLGTIVLPMNIITGLWGMNCLVPGQDSHGLTWFFGISASLFVFGILCYFIAKRVYGIV